MSRFALSLVVACLPVPAAALEPLDVRPSTADEGRFPVAFCFVPEMGYMPELDSWQRAKPEDFAGCEAWVRADWKKKHPWIAKRLTPEVARSLSRWAREEMREYEKVPSVEKLTLKPVRVHPQHGKLLLEATLDALPSHAPLVTRWLKVYLLCDEPSKSIERVTITIRGQVLE